MEHIKERNDIVSWAAYLGCMFVGMGIGMIFDQAGAGMIIGMGGGYIAEGVIEGRNKSADREAGKK